MGVVMDGVGNLKEAVLWHRLEGNKVCCDLCSHRCGIADGAYGLCRVRRNIGGVLYSLVYDKVCAANVDPVEKKPLFHFQPGSRSFSISTPGCNFRCSFCQNWQISQVPTETDGADGLEGSRYSPEDIVDAAVKSGCRSISYTYTEPTVFMELAAECAGLAKKRGLANIFVSNGYMTTEAVDFAAGWLDAVNVDLKAFSDDYYRRFCKARFAPVLDTIGYIGRRTNIWMEITTLIVPGQNDSPQELKALAEFIVKDAGRDVPWHVSRFYPRYRMKDTPPTEPETLELAVDIGREAGLHYVYVGNVPGSRSESTFCYNCGVLLIERCGYRIAGNVIKEGRCPKCDSAIAGVELS